MTIINTKTAPLRRREIVNAWREFAAEETLAGLTLADFETATLDVEMVRDEIGIARSRVAGLLRRRGESDRELRTQIIRVANAVRASEEHGPDSALYRAMGYVPKSERLSGLTRPGHTPPPQEPEGSDNGEAPPADVA